MRERIIPEDISKMISFGKVLEELSVHYGATPNEHIESLRVQAYKKREEARRQVEERIQMEEWII